MKIRWFKSQKNDQNRDSIEGWIQEVHGKNISFNLNCVEIELLALGSSHGAYGFNPLLFSDLFAFSLCSASQDLYYSKMLLSRCIDRMPKCNTVILFYSVFSPGFDLQMTNEKYRCNIYSKYWSIPPQSSDFIINGDKKQVVLPIKIAANVAKNFPRGYDKPVLFYNSDPIEDRVLAHLKHNARENSQNIHLKEMAVDLSSSGIRFVVIIAPVRQDYIKCLQKISSKNNSDFFGELYSISSINQTIHILNYFQDPFFGDTHFGDYDHLNPEGARHLTLRIQSDLRRIG